MESALVSIIVLTFNSEKYLDRCLKSIEIQSYKLLEVIIVDAGSQDKTRDIIERYNNKLNINTYTLAPSTQSEARNLALNHTNGKYIAFCDSDDYYLSDKIKLQVSMLEETETDVSYYDVLHFCSENKTKHFVNKHPQHNDIILECIANQTINLSSIMVRKSFLHDNNIRFPTGDMGRYGEDGNFIFQLAIRKGTFNKLDRPLSMVEVRSDSHTQWEIQWKMKYYAIQYRENAKQIIDEKYIPAINDAIYKLKVKLIYAYLIDKQTLQAKLLATEVLSPIKSLILKTVIYVSPKSTLSIILIWIWKLRNFLFIRRVNDSACSQEISCESL